MSPRTSPATGWFKLAAVACARMTRVLISPAALLQHGCSHDVGRRRERRWAAKRRFSMPGRIAGRDIQEGPFDRIPATRFLSSLPAVTAPSAVNLPTLTY